MPRLGEQDHPIQNILGNLPAADLAKCLRVNAQWLVLALPLLYSTIRLDRNNIDRMLTALGALHSCEGSRDPSCGIIENSSTLLRGVKHTKTLNLGAHTSHQCALLVIALPTLLISLETVQVGTETWRGHEMIAEFPSCDNCPLLREIMPKTLEFKQGNPLGWPLVLFYSLTATPPKAPSTVIIHLPTDRSLANLIRLGQFRRDLVLALPTDGKMKIVFEEYETIAPSPVVQATAPTVELGVVGVRSPGEHVETVEYKHRRVSVLDLITFIRLLTQRPGITVIQGLSNVRLKCGELESEAREKGTGNGEAQSQEKLQMLLREAVSVWGEEGHAPVVIDDHWTIGQV